MKIFFTHSAFRQLKKLDSGIQKRIHQKLEFYISQKSPLSFAEPIQDSRFGDWKFRIGDYRVLFDVKQNMITILSVGHRRDIYK